MTNSKSLTYLRSSLSSLGRSGGTTPNSSTRKSELLDQNPSLIVMDGHSKQEFKFAKRTLIKSTQDSQFFASSSHNNDDDHDGNQESARQLSWSASSSAGGGGRTARSSSTVSTSSSSCINMAMNNVPSIHEKDILPGSLLGNGGFCEVRLARIANDNSDCTAHNNNNNNNNNKHSTNDSDKEYAMKYLSPTKLSRKDNKPYYFNQTPNKLFERGIADLVTEARFLSKLSHENIIGLHFVSEGSLEDNFNCGDNHQRRSVSMTKSEMLAKLGTISTISTSSVTSDSINKTRSVSMDDKEEEYNQSILKKLRHRHQFGYFLLLDPLHETLSHRIEHTFIEQVLPLSSCYPGAGGKKKSLREKVLCSLKQDTSVCTSGSSGASTENDDWAGASFRSTMSAKFHNHHHHSSNNIISKHQLANRLSSLKAIASALQYLHDECNLIFRDIKPDNIGFYRRYHPACHCGNRDKPNNTTITTTPTAIDAQECTCYDEIPKLFDFGLCKELKNKLRIQSDTSANDTFKLTGCTGSRRYMAPEVAFCHPYNQKADVYSFGLVLYQVSSLIVPFEGFNLMRHEKEVLREGLRPCTSLGGGGGGGVTNSIKRRKRTTMLGRRKSSSGEVDFKTRQLAQLASRTLRVWPKELRCLMEECWDGDMRCRPEMKEVVTRLESCIQELTQDAPTNRKLGLRRASLEGIMNRRASLESMMNRRISQVESSDLIELCDENNHTSASVVAGEPSTNTNESVPDLAGTLTSTAGVDQASQVQFQGKTMSASSSSSSLVKLPSYIHGKTGGKKNDSTANKVKKKGFLNGINSLGKGLRREESSSSHKSWASATTGGGSSDGGGTHGHGKGRQKEIDHLSQ